MLAVVGEEIVLLHSLQHGISHFADVCKFPTILTHSLRLASEEGHRVIAGKPSGAKGRGWTREAAHRGYAVVEVHGGDFDGDEGELRVDHSHHQQPMQLLPHHEDVVVHHHIASGLVVCLFHHF